MDNILAGLSWPDHPPGEILILGVGKRAIAVFKEYRTAVTGKMDVGQVDLP
ncbi:MAG: hypothetical protein ACRC78_23600 [Planktothrix sp.]